MVNYEPTDDAHPTVDPAPFSSARSMTRDNSPPLPVRGCRRGDYRGEGGRGAIQAYLFPPSFLEDAGLAGASLTWPPPPPFCVDEAKKQGPRPLPSLRWSTAWPLRRRRGPINSSPRPPPLSRSDRPPILRIQRLPCPTSRDLSATPPSPSSPSPSPAPILGPSPPPSSLSSTPSL